MRLFGFDITRRNVIESLGVLAQEKSLQPIFGQSSTTNWWWPQIRESYTGAWQQNVTLDTQPHLLAFAALYCVVTGISGDISKMRIKLSREDSNGIWSEVEHESPLARVLDTPNHYQDHIKFIEQWVISRLLNGNSYILLGRDDRNVVETMYPLDPLRVSPLVTERGDVYYELRPDDLSGLPETVTVPARFIIHDRHAPLFHPLIGVSPIFACALSATMGNRIQKNSTNLFGNAARPGGLLSTERHIQDDTAARLKADFESNYSGANIGRTAVLGDGLKWQAMSLAPEVMQLIDQLKWTVEDVARAFHYPGYKLGLPLPQYASGPEALTMMYYTDCLQVILEAIESCLDNALGLKKLSMGTEFDLDNLVRMDTKALYESNTQAVTGGWMAPNEARFRANQKPVKGGESPLMQQQNYSLADLAKRSQLADPFASGKPPAPLPPAPDGNPPPNDSNKEAVVVDPEIFLRGFVAEALWAEEL